MLFGHDVSFWVAAIGAAIFKVWVNEARSIVTAIASVAAALFSAWAFTNPTLSYLELNPASYQVLAAALWALMGEGIMRWIIGLANEPTKLLEWIKLWRGKA